VLEARDLNHAIQLISQTLGNEVEVWTNRDTSSGGFERNDEGEQAATATETRDEGSHAGKNE
jgi:hypothetical protein